MYTKKKLKKKIVDRNREKKIRIFNIFYFNL